jgi:hypothetical protein
VTVLALPINLIAGLLGMNVGGIPLAHHGFWIVVSIAAGITFVAGPRSAPGATRSADGWLRPGAAG